MILSKEEKQRLVFPICIWESAPGGKSVHSEARLLMNEGWLNVRPNGLATPDLFDLIEGIYLIEYTSLSVYDFNVWKATAFSTSEKSSWIMTWNNPQRQQPHKCGLRSPRGKAW